MDNNNKTYRKRLYKFRVHDLAYPGLLAQDLQSIRTLLGNFTVVRVKQCFCSLWRMTIWVEEN